jgi:archaellum component FlaF (FlaF/FlaG flagellin family)
MINQLKKIDEIEVTQENTSKIVQCDTCAISKMHRLIQRTSSAKTIKIFQILHFDLIICNKTFDETTCITHFIDELIFYNWVFSLMNHRKKTLLSIFKNLINECDRIKFDERAIIRIIRIDQEIFIDKKLENWVREQEINENWSTKNIFEQNKKSERFDDMLIEKAKYIKKHVKLSKDFYSECYFVAAHILNRTSSSSLSWDSSLIFIQKLLKKSIRNEIAHFKMFDCKTFSLFKEINAFKKSKKMKSRAFIEYLIKYDFINIFRVWNSKKNDVNNYRDVIFNEIKFFDTYEKVDFFKEEEKKFYVTYRAIFMQIFEDSDEEQYDKFSIRKFVLNSFKEIDASKSMMKKRISSSKKSQLFTFNDTSSSEFESNLTINIFVTIEISRRNVSMKNKKMISFLRKNKSLNKENNFFFRKNNFFCFHSSKLSNELFETKNASLNVLTSKNINFRINVVNIVQEKRVRKSSKDFANTT